jgi:flagellar motility protein MotE (MotC chaperone)
MKVFVSQSADLTPAQKKKLVVGGKFLLNVLTITQPRPNKPAVGFIKRETFEAYKKKPPVIKVEKIEYLIEEVETTKTGAIKSVTAYAEELPRSIKIGGGYSVTRQMKLSAAKLQKLLETKVTKDSPKGTMGIILSATSKDQLAKHAENTKIDSDIAKLKGEMAVIQGKIDALVKIKTTERKKIEAAENKKALDKLKAQGYTYVRDIEGKKVKKATLTEARNVNPGVGKKAAIYAVKDGKSQKIMVWSPTDPVTGRMYKGYMWWFTSAATSKKFSVAI